MASKTPPADAPQPAQKAGKVGDTTKVNLNPYVNPNEIGTTGLRRMGGHVYDEFLRNLTGYKAARAFREIAENSPIASGIILGYQNVASHLDWHIEEPPEATERDKAALQFIEEAFEDTDDRWDSTLSQILSMIVFGWSLHEIVYKKRDGKHSKFNDGKIGWQKFPIRSQESLFDWKFAPNGDILAMRQQDPGTGEMFTIPLSKALLFRTSELKNNPEGASLLRGAYIPYQYLRRIQEYEAIGVERDLAGLPVAWVPNEWLTSTDPATKVALQKMISMVQDVRRNEREGLVLPMMYEPELTGAISRNKALDFELLASGGTRQFDTDAIITRYNQQIAMSLLADFITLGQDGVGSFALGTAKLDLWIMVVDSLCKSVAEIFNKHAIERLLQLNGIQYDNPPTLEYGAVENVDLTVLSNAIAAVAAAGLLTPDPGVETWIREKFDMPPTDEEGVMPPAAINAERDAENADINQQMQRQNLETQAHTAVDGTGKPVDPKKLVAAREKPAPKPGTKAAQDAAKK
jgi:hypothetical protein